MIAKKHTLPTLSLLLTLLLGWNAPSAPAIAAEQTPPAVSAELVRARGGLGNVLARLEAGEEVRVGYFGGSITAQNGWRPKTLAWLKQQYPKAQISEINAAIGGTGSDLGVFRYGRDVLVHRPHLVFVEFAVNDGGAAPESIYRAMEGIVRQTWAADPTTDLCFVYTIHRGQLADLAGGNCPRSASAHETIAQYYGIPSINMALRIAQMEAAGELIFRLDPDQPSPPTDGTIVFAPDDCHPHDAGHEIYLQVIADAWQQIAKSSKPGPHTLGKPFREDNWQRATLVPITPEMLQGSWQRMDPSEGLGQRFGNRLPELWNGSKPGDTIRFAFQGTMAGLYDLLGPDGGQVVCTVDGKTGGPRPRFDHYCTYHRLASLKIASGLEEGLHSINIEIDGNQPDRSSVLDRVRDEPNFDPAKYDGTNVWAGYLMMIGELVSDK